MRMVELMSYNPAKILHSDKGTLLPGRAADITIINPDDEYVIDSATFASLGKNTPFNGKKVKGRVVYTIANGKTVYSYRPGFECIVDKDVPKEW
jgi:dihydroorotase